ncbi:MAG: bifunctional hydroxymethylpyrimidine kinase/phosphomethylpyrimidine kinase [Bacillota bacterium]
MVSVLTIAGSDSSGGAGLQADLKTMTRFNVYGASVITAITAQNTLGVQDLEALDPRMVAKQFDSVCSDLNLAAAKTGMLATKEIIEVVIDKVQEYQVANLVVDPVMVATSGEVLLEEKAIATLRDKLLPLAEVITPNLNEAKILTNRELTADVSLQQLAQELYQLGPQQVLVKGGHCVDSQAKDLLYDGENFTHFTAEWVETTNNHGTGCTLSAAIASNLALGYQLTKAVERSKSFVTQGLQSGCQVGGGNNPPNHLVDFWE